MPTTVSLGIKFLIKPISGGFDAQKQPNTQTVLAMHALRIGYRLGVRIYGRRYKSSAYERVVATCLFGAVVAARFANKCDIKKLNRIIGLVLLVLGIATIFTKLFS